MKVEFQSGGGPLGSFKIEPGDEKDRQLLTVIFGAASIMRLPMGITGFQQSEVEGVTSFSVGFVIPHGQQPKLGELTDQDKEAIAAQDVLTGAGNLASADPAGDTQPQSPPEPT